MGQHSDLMFSRIAPGPDCGSPNYSDTVAFENRCDQTDVAGITHREAKVMSAGTITSDSANPATGTQRKPAFVTCDVHHIRKHGTGTRQRTRALAREEHLANRIATNQHSIILIANAGELMRHRQQHRSATKRNSILAQFRSCNMLDYKTQLRGCLHIISSNAANPFDLHRVGVHLRTKRKLGKDFQFLRRIVAVDVECGISFGETPGLRLAKRVLELNTILLHARQNIVARPIQDAAEPLNIIPNQAIPQSANNRNTTANAGFESQANLLPLCSLHQTETIKRKQG